MRTVEVATARPYAVRIGRGALGHVRDGLRARAVLVSDANVAPLHAAALGMGAPLHLLPAGEDGKTFAAVEALLDALAAAGCDRRTTVVALGGGAVGDAAGLAASLWMRGVDVVQCPTTLLAMVDSSVGGKTAVNLRAGKNLAGTVHQPAAVHADLDTLATLPREELRSGLGEVVKSALLGEPGLLELLEREAPRAAAGDPELLGEVVERCVRVKAAVVARDEREEDLRRALNLGHTFGHAIEREAGYGRVPHGVAVAAGLGLALAASARLGLLADAGLAGRVRDLSARLGLPEDLRALRRSTGLPLAPDRLIDAMALDKKGRGGAPRFVLPRALGDVALDAEVPAELLRELLAST